MTDRFRAVGFSAISAHGPVGMFKYASVDFALSALPEQFESIIGTMSQGIPDARVMYRCGHLNIGEMFGHGRWHADGFGVPKEVHRLFHFGGQDTEGEGGVTLGPGIIWEFAGDFQHRAIPAQRNCTRTLIRVSRTNIKYRNYWQ